MQPELKEMTLDVLAAIYASVEWHKMRTRKRWMDIWNHRIRQAATRITIGEFLSKLCNHLGIQALPPSAADRLQDLNDLLKSSDTSETELLDWIYREHAVVSTASALRARSLRGGQK